MAPFLVLNLESSTVVDVVGDDDEKLLSALGRVARWIFRIMPDEFNSLPE
jgi:hypothetical protein